MSNVGGRITAPSRVAGVVYPVAVGGFTLAALLNAITWLPVNVSGLTPVWVALFLVIFPTWFPVVLILQREQKAYYTENPKRRWYQSRYRLPFARTFIGVPPWLKLVGYVVVAYVAINFFASIAGLPGQPEMSGNRYFFNDHGREIPTDLQGYLAGLRYQMRIFTGHPMIFYGVAALTMYGRRAGTHARPPNIVSSGTVDR